MPTRLYLSSDETALFSPGVHQGAWDKTTGSNAQRFSPERVGAGVAISNSENVATNNYDVLICTFVSDPLQANTSISGTINAILLASESNADANDVLHLHLWVTQGDSATPRGTLLADYIDAAEWAVGSASSVSAITVASQAITTVNALAGDRLVAEVGYQAQNTHTTNRSGFLKIGGGTSDADGTESAVSPNNVATAWIEFSTTLTFAPTYLYLTDTTVPVVPAAFRGTWGDTSQSVNKYLGRVKADSSAQVSPSETSLTAIDVLASVFVGDPLAAQTITATVLHIVVGMLEATTTADAFQKVHLYVMAPDGSVRGTLLTDAVSATELSTTFTQRHSPTMTSVAALAGDRLVLELGASFTNVTATSRGMSLRRGATTGEQAVSSLVTPSGASTIHAGWIRFAQTLVWQAAGFAHSQVVIVG